MTEKSARFSVKDAIIVTLALATVLAAGYAWMARTPAERSAGPPEPVTMAINAHYTGTGLVFVAHVKGYFANEGLNVTLQPHTTGKIALDTALEGRADLATVADIPLMFAVTKGQPVSIVATISVVDKDPGIIGRKDKGVSTLASLHGKRIGVTLGTSGHFVLDAFLIRQRLSTEDVTLLDQKPEEHAEALAKGDIDAVATWEPYLGMLRMQLGANGAIFYSDGIYELPFNIAGAQEYVVSHPETIKKLLRALVRAEFFYRDEPDAARRIIADAMNVSLESMKEVWPTYRFTVALNQSLVLTLEDQTRWAIKNQLTPNPTTPNYLNYLYLDGLRAVKPEAMTVIH